MLFYKQNKVIYKYLIWISDIFPLHVNGPKRKTESKCIKCDAKV